ncbi:hypothetical protein SESBI_01838 [Sesbania bispinosa]|nr:hypothetical protein SESBI_01838 [Sesbania bispinosa]
MEEGVGGWRGVGGEMKKRRKREKLRLSHNEREGTHLKWEMEIHLKWIEPPLSAHMGEIETHR